MRPCPSGAALSKFDPSFLQEDAMSESIDNNETPVSTPAAEPPAELAPEVAEGTVEADPDAGVFVAQI